MLYNKPFLDKISVPFDNTPLNDISFSVVDTETCGLWKGSKIVELALVITKNGEIMKQHQWLVNPGIPIPPEATKVNKITDDMVKNEPNIREVLHEFIPLIKDTVLVAHNSSYDEPVISTDAARQNIWLPPVPFIDTLALSKALITDQESYSLGNLASFFEISSENFHRALDDTLVTAKLLNKLIKKMYRINESTYEKICYYGQMTKLGDSAHPIDKFPPGRSFLKLAISTKSDLEIHYEKDNRIIEIPSTILSGFFHRGHYYLEVRDQRKYGGIRTLRLDRIQQFYPLT